MPMFRGMTQRLVIGVNAVAVAASNASAALTVDPIATTDFMTVAGAVVVALGAFYAVKKALGLLR